VNEEIAKCWTFARVNLPAVTERDFWRLTPREFAALRTEWESAQNESKRGVAAICATICNASGGYDRVFNADDFLRMPPRPGEGPDIEAAFDILKYIKQD
jgi:hypothetical protein